MMITIIPMMITITTLTTHLMASLILALLLAVLARLSRLARLGDTERDRVLQSVDIIYFILDIFIASCCQFPLTGVTSRS